jgi:thiol-disulfide isomerase/thioredoxin
MAANRPRPNKGSKSRQAASEPPKKSFPIVPVVFVAIGAILVAAIVFTGGDSDAGPQFGDVELSGAALARYPASGFATIAEDPALGETIPTVTGSDLDGNEMTISADGTPKAIAFLAHWCNHCQAEVPRVTEWIDETGGVDGVELVAVTTSIDSVRGNYPPDKWLRDENWPAPTMRDDQGNSAHLSYGGGGFPYWVFVNGDGQVVARTAGQTDIGTLQGLMGLARDG